MPPAISRGPVGPILLLARASCSNGRRIPCAYPGTVIPTSGRWVAPSGFLQSYSGMTLPGRPPRPFFGRWVAPSGFLPPNAGILFGMTLPGRPPRRLFRRWVAPSGFLPPNAGILFGDDSPGPAHSRGRGRIILHTGGAWRIPPGAYPPRVGALELLSRAPIRYRKAPRLDLS